MLASIRNPPDPEELGRLMQADLKWDRVVEVSQSARVASQLYYRLKMLPESAGVPTATIEELQQLTFSQIFHWLNLRRVLEDVLAGFSRLHIPVITLKGAALATGVYEDSSLRVVGDLDLLIREADINMADELVLSLGFTRSAGEEIGPDHHHLPGYYRGENIRVELHRHIVPPPVMERIPIEEFWSRSRPLDETAGAMTLFAPEHLLLHICIHSAWSHMFRGMLYQLCDIREIIRRYGSSVNWEALVTEAGAGAIRRPVFYALHAAADLMGAKVPGEVLSELAPRGARFTPRHSAILSITPTLALGRERCGPFPDWFLAETCRGLMAGESEAGAWMTVGANLMRRSRQSVLRRMRPEAVANKL